MASELGGNIQITPVGGSATQYPLAVDPQSGQLAWTEGPYLARSQAPTIPIQVAWEVMTPGGMGETKRVSNESIGNAYTVGMDAHAYGFVRLAPRKITVTPTVAPVDKPTKGFEVAETGDIPTPITITDLEDGSGTTAAADIIMRSLTSGGDATAGVTQNKLTELNSTTVQTVYTTASVAPADNKLVLVTVFSDSANGATPAVPTVAGGGMTTWDQVATQAFPSQGARITVFRAMEATPGTATITATFTASQDRCKISVSEFGNVDPAGVSDNGASAIVQSKTGASSGLANNLTVTFDAAFAQSNNATFAAFAAQVANGGSAGVNYSPALGMFVINTALTTGGSASQRTILKTAWKDEEALSVGVTTTSGVTSYLAGIVVEIAAVVGGSASAVFQTESISPTGNNLVIAAVHGFRDAGASAAPTLTGNGITWTAITSQVFDTDHRISLFRGMVASPTAGSVTITFAAAQDSARWSIMEFANVDTGGTHGSAAVVQSAAGTETGQTTFDAITLSAFGAAANATFGAYAINNTGGMTAGTGFTEIHDVATGGGLMTQWRIDNDTTPTATSTDSGNWGGIAIEIKSAAPSGTYVTGSFTPTKERLILATIHNTKATPTTPTLNGFNLTWDQVDTETQGNERVTVFRAMAHTDLSADVLTINFGGTAQDVVRWSVKEFDGVLTTGDEGADAVVQTVSATAASAASLTITLAALAESTNATYGAFASTAADLTPGAGYDLIHEVTASTDTLLTEWRDDGNVTVDASNAGGVADMRFAEGTYTGDGTLSRQVDVPFQPKVVLVKADHATNGHAMFRSDTMSAAQNFTNATEDQGISALNASGFTVDHVASAVGRTNESGKTYYWVALGGSDVETGTYTGNGTTQTITGLGAIEMVWVRRTTTNSNSPSTYLRTIDMSTESYDFGVSAGATDEITALTADGFSVGAGTECNESGVTFHYIAFLPEANWDTGTYAGNSTDNRDLPASAMAFDPEWVVIKADAGQEAVQKASSLSSDAALQFGSVAQVSNRIQSLTSTSGKFQVGTDAEVNNSAISAYYFFAFGSDSGDTAAWAGIGIEIQAGSEPGGFTGDAFIYAQNGQHNTKMSVDNTPTITVEAQHDFGAAASCGGNPAYYGTPSWYIPLGRFKTAEVLKTVNSSGDDEYEEMNAANGYSGPGDVRSQAFAVSTQGAASSLLRAFDGNKVDVSTDGKTFGADFNVGSAAETIQAMVDSGAVLFVGTDSNLHQFDSTGVSFQLTRFNVSDTSINHGSGMLVPEGSEVCFFPHEGIFFWNGSRPIHVSVDANPLNRPIPNVTHEPVRVEFTEIVYGSDEWLWAAGRVTENATTKTYIFAMNRRAESVVWHTIDRFDGAARLIPIDGSLDSNHRLWYADITGAKYGFIQLGPNGEPDAGRDSLGYGAVSTTYQLYLPRTDWGFSHDLKQLQSVEVKLLDVDSTCPLSIKVHRDQGTEESVGSAISDEGVTERFWTLGTNDTAYDTMLLLEIATTGSFDTDTDPQILSVAMRGKLRPKMTREVSFTVDTTLRQRLPDDAASFKTKLEALVEASPPSIIDPNGNTLNIAITSVESQPVSIDTQGQAEYYLKVNGYVWATS